MSSTKKERIKKRHASRNRRVLKKMVRNIANIAHTLRYPQIIAKVGDFYLPIQSGRNIIFRHGQETQCEMITRLPNKKEKYDEDCIMINGGGDGNENKETENSGKEKEDSDKRIEKA